MSRLIEWFRYRWCNAFHGNAKAQLNLLTGQHRCSRCHLEINPWK